MKKPTFIIDEKRARVNIQRMAEKCQDLHISLRPHFKTHQSHTVGSWFRDEGLTSITISSVEMARYFAADGWQDITIAFPVNLRETDDINELAETCTPGVLIEAPDTAARLDAELRAELPCWIKIDTGLHRTGIDAKNFPAVLDTVRAIAASKHLRPAGLLTHAGHTYKAQSVKEVKAIHDASVAQMTALKKHIMKKVNIPLQVSIGDTPGALLGKTFTGVDEMRPGNFVYFDVMQYFIGACSIDDIACRIACPVVALHRERNEAVIYGGAVHLSKEQVTDSSGKTLYGLVCDQHGKLFDGCYVKALSQEHGVVYLSSDYIDNYQPGDLMYILPVHSCLSANLLRDATVFQ